MDTGIVNQIAAAWGTSRAYVYKLGKKGCPIQIPEDSSVEELIKTATEWRIANSRHGVGYRSKKSNNPPTEGAGTENEEIQPSGPVWPPPKARKKVKVDTIERSLDQAIAIERQCAEEVERLSNDPGKLVTAINAYNKAQNNRMDTEKRVLELLEKRGQLISLPAAQQIITRVWVPFLMRLRACPRNAAQKANPQDDVLAEEAIRLEIEAAIEEGQKEYAKAM